MAKYKLKPIEALQLRWDNWDQMCEFAGVGSFELGRPEGCFVSPEGQIVKEGDSSNRIGLKIPSGTGSMLARQGDYVIKGPCTNALYIMHADVFEATYELVTETTA